MRHHTVIAAQRRLGRLRRYHGRWYPTTYEQPLHDNPRGAVKVLPAKA